ncbi:MAG: DUF4173 domain-containing protein [Bacteroidetes bacterium]|nr:DUF4173 domain-containing protein [Bacteroidota bacterium]
MKTKTKVIELVIGMIFFHILFWHERIGLNALLFAVLTIGYNFGFNSEFLKNKKLLFHALTLLLASVGVILFNSIPSKIAFFAAYIIYIGFSWRPEFKTVFAAALIGLNNLFSSVFTALGNISNENSRYLGKFKIYRVIKIAVIPIIVAFVFILIFRQANPVFAKYTNSFMEAFLRFFDNISWAWVFFMALGFVVITAILYKGIYAKKFDRELQKGEYVLRMRASSSNNTDRPYSRFKNMYWSGIVLIILVNIIALIINIIDINYVWFGFEEQQGINYKQMVHEGTYYLILSILLSMIILLYYFRSNFNFYSKNSLLKILAYIWIAQNGFMGISVLIRNLLYIGHFGLAYKRIGVMIYLVLVLIGLITMIIKIRDKRSGFYLFRLNSLATFIMLIVMSLVNWDVWIAAYNLKHNYPSEIDERFLVRMSVKAYPLLFENADKLNEIRDYHDYNYTIGSTIRKENKAQEKNSFMSWNVADYKAMKYLEEKGIIGDSY